MNISLNDLRSALERLLKHVEAEYGSTVELDADYYWSIPKGLRYDVYQQPGEFTIGSLVDDYAEIRKLCEADRDLVSSDLVYIGRVLAALGEEKLV